MLLGYLGQVVLATYASGARATHMITCVLCCSVLLALQLLHTQQHWAARRRRYRAATLSAQAVLTYLPLPWLGDSWGVAADFLAASVLLLLPARLKWLVFLAVGVGSSLLAGLRHQGPALGASIASATLGTGLAIYSISRTGFLEAELRRARAGLGLAIWQERQRFARDLHDLLGHSLSVITLKTEVAMRHVPQPQEQVKEELTSILAVSRQALREVRHVAHSYRSLSLATELEACVALLRRASIKVDVRTSVRPPESRSGTVLAIVLREAVTNMLQHSKVRHCAIVLDQTGGRLRLSIVNNGTGLEGHHDDPSPSPTGSAGCRGLTNLDIRLAEVGGTLTAGRRSGGRFEVLAEVPDGTGDGDRGGRRLSEPGGRGRWPEQERRKTQRGVRTDQNRMPGGPVSGCDLLGGRLCEGSTLRKFSAEP
ncbi:sensor histidine kinase [Streptomyces sp. B21-083]|uniref:sensor histidine kinase n=1 Tax=Streptomyces sp. B21-083 TaxID=3039410 RepID=UPI002FF0FA53